jgi:hypothetical protein
MPVLCDFTIIHGTLQGVQIGDGGFKPVWETPFNTGGRRSTGHAFITFLIRGLTFATEPLPIRINNEFAGHIFPYVGADPNYWFSQTINISGALLNDGNNEFEVPAAINPSANGGTYDDYFLRNIFCFFQQST